MIQGIDFQNVSLKRNTICRRICRREGMDRRERKKGKGFRGNEAESRGIAKRVMSSHPSTQERKCVRVYGQQSSDLEPTKIII